MEIKRERHSKDKVRQQLKGKGKKRDRGQRHRAGRREGAQR